MNNVILYIAILLSDGGVFISMSERWHTEFDNQKQCYEFVATGEAREHIIEKYHNTTYPISAITYVCAPRKPERLD